MHTSLCLSSKHRVTVKVQQVVDLHVEQVVSLFCSVKTQTRKKTVEIWFAALNVFTFCSNRGDYVTHV